MFHNYTIFVSSTSDLVTYRAAAREVIDELELRPLMYEDWVPTPNNPITECLDQIAVCNLVILIAGGSYGSEGLNGNSITENEFNYALQQDKAVLAFLLDSDSIDEKQQNFRQQINSIRSRGNIIDNATQFKVTLKRSIIQHFIRLGIWGLKEPTKSIGHDSADYTTFIIPETTDEAINFLLIALENRQDEEIHRQAVQFMKLFPENPSILTLLALAETNLGLNEKEFSKSIVETAVEIWESKGFPIPTIRSCELFNIGNAYIVLNRLTDAERIFRLSLEEDNTFAQAWKNLGEVYRQKFDHQLARECYEKALQYDPMLFEALYSIASLERSEGNYDAALSALSRISTHGLSEEHRYAVTVRKFQALMKLEYYPEAATVFQDILGINAEVHGLWEWGAYLYSILFRQDKKWTSHSIKFWREYLKRFPKDSNAWNELGRCLYSIDDNSNMRNAGAEALDAFSKAHNLGFVDDGLLFDSIAHIKEDIGDYKEAERMFRLAVRRSPNKYSHCLGSLLCKLHDYKSALPFLELQVSGTENQSLHLSNLGVCYAMLQRYKEAEASFMEAIRIDPTYPVPYFELGGVLWNSGQVLKAVEAWETAVISFPSYSRVNQATEMIDLYKKNTKIHDSEKNGYIYFSDEPL